MKNLRLAAVGLILGIIPSISVKSEEVAPVEMPQYTPDYTEIPYYVRKLEETDLEGDRVKYNKIIHDAIVSADLSDKKVVKKMEPLIEQVRVAMDSNLDRTNISGQATWLGSAVDYFESEKLRKEVDVPADLWISDQTISDSGVKISVFPEQILIHKGSQTEVLVEHTNIHEAIISADGKWVAFYRLVRDSAHDAEIFSVHIKKAESRKIASVPYARNFLFSLDGKYLFFQGQPDPDTKSRPIYRISPKGGRLKEITQGTMLKSVIKSGKFEGDLVIYRQHKHPLGAKTLRCPTVITPAGKIYGVIKNVPCD